MFGGRDDLVSGMLAALNKYENDTKIFMEIFETIQAFNLFLNKLLICQDFVGVGGLLDKRLIKSRGACVRDFIFLDVYFTLLRFASDVKAGFPSTHLHM